MPSDTLLTLSEVRRKIDDTLQMLIELRVIENGLVQKYLPTAEQMKLVLQFDDSNRKISWLGNTIVLNTKPYFLLKAIWNAPKHCAYFETLEKEVWNCRDDEDVSIETIKSLVKRTNETLATRNVPFKIYPLKCERTGIDGYRLKNGNDHNAGSADGTPSERPDQPLDPITARSTAPFPAVLEIPTLNSR